jgi:hypothetical protein
MIVDKGMLENYKFDRFVYIEEANISHHNLEEGHTSSDTRGGYILGKNWR